MRRLTLLLVLALAAPAGAADTLIVRDTHVSRVLSYKDTLLYARSLGYRKKPLARQFMRVVDGRRSRAHLPKRASIGGIGPGGATYGIDHPKVGIYGRVAWFRYDVRHDRSRRVAGMRGCRIDSMRPWGPSVAFSAICDHHRKDGIYLRRAGKTKRISEYAEDEIAYDGSSVLALRDRGDDDFDVARINEQGRACHTTVPWAYGVGLTPWLPRAVFTGGTTITWAMGDGTGPATFTLLQASRTFPCGPLVTAGVLPFHFKDPTVSGFWVDRRLITYAVPSGIRRATLPAPDLAPPANDDIADAEPVTDAPPFERSGRIGYATVEPGEPATHGALGTVWYRWTPPADATVYVNADVGNWAAYTGTPTALVELARSNDGPLFPPIKVKAGQSVWFQLGSLDAPPTLRPYTLGVQTTVPGTR